MPNEPPSDSPVTDPKNGDKAQINNSEPASVQYDDFGLPIRNARRRSALEEDSAGTNGDAADSVEKKPPSPTKGLSESERIQNAKEAVIREGPEKLEQQVNGHSEPKKEVEQASEPMPYSKPPTSPTAHTRQVSNPRASIISEPSRGHPAVTASEWSHQQLAPQTHKEVSAGDEDDVWQEMPAYAPYDIYNDDNKLVAREAVIEDDDQDFTQLGGAAKGYTRVQMDEDAQSATSMDDNTAYLFKEQGTNVIDEDEGARDPLSQMQTTKGLLTEGQRIAYVGLVRLAMVQMTKELDLLEKTKGTKSVVNLAAEAMQMWSQKMMVRLYGHMDINSSGEPNTSY